MAFTLAENRSCLAPNFSLSNAPSTDLSCLYTILPSAVKSRIPILPSIRRSVEMVVTTRKSKPRRTRSQSAAELHGFTDSGNLYCSPDNELVTREQLWQMTKRQTQSRPDTPDTMPSTPSDEEGPAGQKPADVGILPPSLESRSGVDWNIATPGIMLLNNARYQVVRQPDTDPAILRSLHIDGLTYLLRSLPTDLRPRELEDINDVLPKPLQGMIIDGHQVRPYNPTLQSQKEQNVLRRSITYSILQLALFISFLVPLLTTLFNRCVRYERQHQLTERFLTNGIGAADTVGVRGLDLKEAVVKFGHGRVGGALWDAGAWVVEGVAGGFSDGIGKAMMIVGQAVIASSQPNTAEQEGMDMQRRR